MPLDNHLADEAVERSDELGPRGGATRVRRGPSPEDLAGMGFPQ